MRFLSPTLPSRRSRREGGLLLPAFYALLALLLLSVVTGALDSVLPQRIASRVAYNSEAVFFVLVVGPWIHLRRNAPAVARRVWVVVPASLCLAALGGLLLLLDLPARLVTLNEPAFAAALSILYISLSRPLPRFVPWANFVFIVVVVWVAVAQGNDSWVIDQAEAIGFIALLPFALDVVDREILEPGVGTSTPTRFVFYALLVAEPVIVSALGTGAREGGSFIALSLEFLGRVHESVFGVLLISLIFAVILAPRSQELPLKA